MSEVSRPKARVMPFTSVLRRWWPFLVPAAAAFWTLVTASLTAWWTVEQYKGETTKFLARLASDDKARQEARSDADLVRRIQAQQPFLEKQLGLYFETIKVVAKLANPVLKKEDAQWKDNVARFWELRWAELEMVGDAGIREAMRRVQQQLIETEFDQERNRHDLRWSIECLADELRLSLEHAWAIKRDPDRITAAGNPASKLPNGCNSDQTGVEVIRGMQPLRAPGNAY
jgi:hypothetical protein